MPKRSIAPLVNGRVRLRLLEEADLPMTLAWRNKDDIRRWLFSPDIIAPDQHRAWFSQYADRDDDFVFVIEETKDLKRPVGQASIYHVDWAGGRAEFGRLMIGDPDARRLGLARLATERLLEEAVVRWRLSDIRLEVIDTNEAALGLYRACGFEVTERRDGVIAMRNAVERTTR